MKKCIIISDSYKGTMSSIEVCNIMSEAVFNHFPGCLKTVIPIADGGEGTVECFYYAIGGELVSLTVANPYREAVDVQLLIKENMAIVEMAKAAGLPLVENRKNPTVTTTFGVGEMIRCAVERGCNHIIVGLGGSCTNDGGTGMAEALGTRFYNKAGELLHPTGGTLSQINKIDTSETERLLKNCHITAMCDVDNTMYGENGAAYVYAPQKGADVKMVVELDKNLRHLSKKIKEYCGIDVSQLKGAGAAGGMGAGIVAFLNGELKSGIDTILDTVHFDEKLNGTDVIFTGEGKIDSQSLRGKVVVGVSRRAQKKPCPVVAVVGDIGENIESAYALGVSAIFSINHVAIPFSESRHRSKADLADTMDNILRLIKLTENK